MALAWTAKVSSAVKAMINFFIFVSFKMVSKYVFFILDDAKVRHFFLPAKGISLHRWGNFPIDDDRVGWGQHNITCACALYNKVRGGMFLQGV